MEVRVATDKDVKKLGPYLSTEITPARAIVFACYDDYEPMGVMVIDQIEKDAVSIEWIYTGENYRGRGVATALVGFLKEWVDAKNMTVMSYFRMDPVLRHIFAMAGFDMTSDSVNEYEVSMESLGELLSSQLKTAAPANIIPLAEAGEKPLSRLIQAIDDSMDVGGTDYIRNLLFQCNSYISHIVVEDNEISGVMAVEKINENEMAIELLWGCQNSTAAMQGLFTQVYRTVCEKEPAIKTISFTAADEKVERFAKTALHLEPATEIDILNVLYFGSRNRGGEE